MFLPNNVSLERWIYIVLCKCFTTSNCSTLQLLECDNVAQPQSQIKIWLEYFTFNESWAVEIVISRHNLLRGIHLVTANCAFASQCLAPRKDGWLEQELYSSANIQSWWTSVSTILDTYSRHLLQWQKKQQKLCTTLQSLISAKTDFRQRNSFIFLSAQNCCDVHARK